MKMRFLGAAVALCAAVAMSGNAEAAKRRSNLVMFDGCAVWTPPSCIKVGGYNLVGAVIWPGTRVSGVARSGYVSYCGNTAQVVSIKYHGPCIVPMR